MKTKFGALLCVLAVPTGPSFFSAPAAAETQDTTQQRVAAAQNIWREAVLSNDFEARVGLYRPDARSMPEYQPALYGTDQIAAYHRVMQGRLTTTRFDPATREIFDFGGTIVEFGTFTAAWTKADGSADTREGKYANVWALEADGSLRLKADVWGYFETLPDPETFFVAMEAAEPRPRASSPDEQRLADIIRASNDSDQRGVRERDVEARIARYTDDAVLMPFADRMRSGMAEIRPYLTAYVAAGEGIQFDDVRVWNTGFEDFGDYVLEYSKFRVDWRLPERSGVTKGGGLRLLKRQPDGSLKYHRQIGTHDHG